MRLYFLTLLLFCFAILPTNMAIAAAPDIAPQPCDARYWEQMSSRAWMEAQREIMQNQNLIFKPDSVLEYVCFDQFANIAAHQGGQIFTHTTYFGNEIIRRGSNEAMEVAIMNVVTGALNQYVQRSFGHDFLGGRATHMSIQDKDSQFRPPTQPVGYTCDVMKNVWQTAKCANYIDSSIFEGTDGFYPFKTLRAHNGGQNIAGYDDIQETRLFPSSLSCRSSSVGARGNSVQSFGPAGTWNQQISQSENDGLYPYQIPLQQIFQEVGDKLEPGKCGQPAIKTGIMIYPSNGQPYEDGICTNPGCIFNRTGYCIAPATNTGTDSSITTQPPVDPVTGAGSAGGG